MDDTHFIGVKSMAGELIFSQKRRQLRCTLTTKEVIFQQPDATYLILLEDIIGMVPFQLENPRNHIGATPETQIVTHFPQDYYKICACKTTVINRGGVHERRHAHLIIPLNRRFIDKLDKHGGFTVLPT